VLVDGGVTKVPMKSTDLEELRNICCRVGVVGTWLDFTSCWSASRRIGEADHVSLAGRRHNMLSGKSGSRNLTGDCWCPKFAIVPVEF
jgi:hypothetical protein